MKTATAKAEQWRRDEARARKAHEAAHAKALKASAVADRCQKLEAKTFAAWIGLHYPKAAAILRGEEVAA